MHSRVYSRQIGSDEFRGICFALGSFSQTTTINLSLDDSVMFSRKLGLEKSFAIYDYITSPSLIAARWGASHRQETWWWRQGGKALMSMVWICKRCLGHCGLFWQILNLKHPQNRSNGFNTLQTNQIWLFFPARWWWKSIMEPAKIIQHGMEPT